MEGHKDSIDSVQSSLKSHPLIVAVPWWSLIVESCADTGRTGRGIVPKKAFQRCDALNNSCKQTYYFGV